MGSSQDVRRHGQAAADRRHAVANAGGELGGAEGAVAVRAMEAHPACSGAGGTIALMRIAAPPIHAGADVGAVRRDLSRSPAVRGSTSRVRCSGSRTSASCHRFRRRREGPEPNSGPSSRSCRAKGPCIHVRREPSISVALRSFDMYSPDRSARLSTSQSE
jgi:hypothetical protein